MKIDNIIKARNIISEEIILCMKPELGSAVFLANNSFEPIKK